MTPEEANELYTKTIMEFNHYERGRFRILVLRLLREVQGYPDIPFNDCWIEAVTKGHEIAKYWVPYKVQQQTIAKLNAAEDEYNEAIAAQGAIEQTS